MANADEFIRMSSILREREACEDSLLKFLATGWKYIDPARFDNNWHLEAIAEHLQAVTDGQIQRLVINIPPRTSKSSICSVAWPAWTWAQSQIGPLSGPHVQFLSASYAHTLSLRDSVKTRRLIQSSWYQGHWGDRFQLTGDQNAKHRFENTKGGYRLATSVDGTTTGEGGDIIIVDDPHKAGQESESEAVRETTLNWWDEVMSTRLNDQNTGAYVIVMQRLHMEDLTGHVLTRQAGSWTHLMLPMEYESSRRCVTIVKGEKFWEEPREEEGQLLCESRFNAQVVENLKRDLGPYACTPAESPVLMSDLTLQPISKVRAGDEVVGFTTETNQAKNRRSLIRAKVLKTYQYFAPVVKVTLDSGEVIRCTEDHKWYMGKQGGKRGKTDTRPLYRPAIVGRKLMRVCPSSLAQPNSVGSSVLTPYGEREAGWLAGFFDGEGSVSNCEKRSQVDLFGEKYRPSIGISFYQTAEKNLPVCERLETALRALGFDFSVVEDKRKDKPHWQLRRQYKLLGVNLPLCQKFLHEIRPTRWRDRITEGAYGARFIASQEEVVSIEADGEELVYALETTTGNYVVWGLASSNSAGQLQQAPAPRGGGLIKDEWWRHWTDARYPQCEFVLGSLDTAYTEKSENDFSALSIWGVFRQDVTNVIPLELARQGSDAIEKWYLQQRMKVILLYQWQERLNFPDLVKKVIETCTTTPSPTVTTRYRFKIDKLIIENKAAGISVAQELHRQLGFSGDFGVELVGYDRGKWTPDKIARLVAVQHLFADGTVHVPWPTLEDGSERPYGYEWVEKAIDEVGAVPKVKHDDFCFVAGTLIATRRGQIPIERIRIGEEVFTPVGWRTVIQAGFTGVRPIISKFGLAGTPNHPVFTVDKGYVPLDSVTRVTQLSRLSLCDLLRITLQKRLNSMALSTAGWAGQDDITSLSQVQMQGEGKLRGFMLRFGSSILGNQFRGALKSIIRTMILSISCLRIWSAYRKASIVGILRTWIRVVLNTWREFVPPPLLGIALQKVVNGIENMPMNPSRSQIISLTLDQCGDSESVSGVESHLISRAKKGSIALQLAKDMPANLGLENANLAPVFNLTVEGAACYYANNILVHNCDSMTQALRWLRDTGMLLRPEEHQRDVRQELSYNPSPKPLYPGV